MTKPIAQLLPGGSRLHLQHGPIDLILVVDGDRDAAFRAAHNRFQTVLTELVAELSDLRAPLPPDNGNWSCRGTIAQRMCHAVAPHAPIFITPMAAVAGAVADTILSAMRATSSIRKAYVNNGGDIALHLEDGESFTTAMLGLDGDQLGRIRLTSEDAINGIATSGAGGRSLSFGIAESVTVLAHTAAAADAAATLIANAVDLPGHPAIRRSPASDHQPDSDLGDREIVIGCGPLSLSDIDQALDSGLAVAQSMQARGLIASAALFLRGRSRLQGGSHLQINEQMRKHAHG